MKMHSQILLIAALIACFSACGEKEAVEPNDGASLARTTWRYEGATFDSELTFTDDENVYHREHYSQDNSDWSYWGTYHYEGANGTMWFKPYGVPYELKFSCDGDRMDVRVVGQDGVYEHFKTTYVAPDERLAAME